MYVLFGYLTLICPEKAGEG